MVLTESEQKTRQAKHKQQIKDEICLAIDSFFLSHPSDISDRDWLKLVGQVLDIINTRRL